MMESENSSKTNNPRNLAIIASIVIITGITAVCILSNWGVKPDKTIFGILLISSLASLLLGGLLGFIFGIPKFNPAYDPNDDYKKKHKYDVNTNLESISDKLTSMIVGITLVQAIKIPGYFSRIAEFVLGEDATKYPAEYAHALVIGVILYFIIAGFIISYLYTRITLPKIFGMGDENTRMLALAEKNEFHIACQKAGIEMIDTFHKNNPGVSLPETPENRKYNTAERAVLKNIANKSEKRPTPNEHGAVKLLLHRKIVNVIDSVENWKNFTELEKIPD